MLAIIKRINNESKVTVILGEIFGPDLLVVFVVVAVVIFGGSQIPKLARNLGAAKTEFERGIKSVKVPKEGTNNTSDTQESDAS
jgi:TatA/E family protein of Tat protein translocase